jgi:integrase
MNTGAGKPVEYEIEVYGAGTAVELAHVEELTRPRWVLNEEPSSDAPFGFLYASNYGYHDRVGWAFEWEKAAERWLHSGRRRSPHTRRSYRMALMQFKEFALQQLGIEHMWRITDHHVQAWIVWMDSNGLAKRTIGQRLAALSSYFDYCGSTTFMHDGRECSLFVDAWGNTRQNPFTSHTVERPRVQQFSTSVAVPGDAYTWIINDLRERIEERPWNADARRNLALMLMFGFCGWRNEEVICMTWGKLTPNPDHAGQYTYRWTGKARDGQEEKRTIPAIVFNAIKAYLKEEGRYEEMKDDDYIWRPRRVHGCENFANVTRIDENRHITQSTVNGVLQGLLRTYFNEIGKKSGVGLAKRRAWAKEQAAKCSIHSLRHMFAKQMYEACGNDIVRVSKMLGHKSLATTQVYLQNLSEPSDDYSELLARQLGLEM